MANFMMDTYKSREKRRRPRHDKTQINHMLKYQFMKIYISSFRGFQFYHGIVMNFSCPLTRCNLIELDILCIYIPVLDVFR